MMGIKERRFDPLPREVSLEDLVPQDNFYRRLQAALDLSFVRARSSSSSRSSRSSSRACARSVRW